MVDKTYFYSNTQRYLQCTVDIDISINNLIENIIKCKNCILDNNASDHQQIIQTSSNTGEKDSVSLSQTVGGKGEKGININI